ncbi:MAG TPA: ACP S-malonyltransferase [Holophagaceae bacterium]|nr:ACP S-malonyltransferase [Holophagaceae bacterium]
MSDAAFLLLFPGQATEAVGMSKGWTEDPAWVATLAAAEAHTGYPLRLWMAEGPLEALRSQRHAPCAVLSHSVGLFRAHRAAGMPLPAAATGHSMGFFSALVAAEVVPLEAALDLISATEDEAERRFGPGTMGMAYAIGLKEADLRGRLEAFPDLELSNVNGTAQGTVSGPLPALEAFVAAVKPDCMKADLLPVRHPLHCGLMAPLLPYVKDRLTHVLPRDPAFPLVSPLDGRDIRDGFEAWEEAIVSISATIHWPLTVKGLRAFAGRAFECGHGRQLAGLTLWLDREFGVESLQTPRSWS